MRLEEKWRETAKEVEGIYSVEALAKRMGVGKRTAVNYVHELRKKGFVETMRGKRGKRLYKINPLRLRNIGNPGIYDLLNRYSSLKLQSGVRERIVGYRIEKPEELLVRALLTRDFRVVLSAVELFRIIKDWKYLYSLAKKHKLERFIAALYFLSRRYFRVRRMDHRMLNMIRKSKIKERYLIPNIESSDFKDIQKEWGVFLPFNKSDMDRLRVKK